MATRQQFGLVDYLVFVVTIVISVVIGIYYALAGNRQMTTSDFLLAGRRMSFLPVGISLFVSYESSIMMLGLPAESYMYGIQLFVGLVPLLLVNVLCAWITVPLMHPLKITSTYEYLQLRFKSRAVRMLGSTIGVAFDIWYMGIVLFGPAVALQAVTDFPLWVSIGGLALAAIIYTSIGGLKAVIWTDVFQTAVMFSGILAVLIQGTVTVGGPKAVWDTASKGARMHFFEFNPDPRIRHTFWNLCLAYIVQGYTFSFKQSTVLRVGSTRTVSDARKVMLFVGPASFLVSVLALYEGIVAYAYFATKECDPFKSGRLDNPNQIVPYIVMDIFSHIPGMPGLFVASLFSASLSTLSSCLSSVSALLWTDFVHPAVGDIAEWKATLIAKVSAVVCGLIACGISGLISLIGGTLIQIGGIIMASFLGPLTGLFFLGCFFPRTNAKGATIGGALAFAITCWISSGMNSTPGIKKTPYLPPASTANCYALEVSYNATDVWTANGNTAWTIAANQTEAAGFPEEKATLEGLEHMYSVSYTLVGPIGILSTVAFGNLFSLLTGANKPGDVDPRYLLPLSDSLLVFLPKPLRRWLSSKGTQFIARHSSDHARLPHRSDAPEVDDGLLMTPSTTPQNDHVTDVSSRHDGIQNLLSSKNL